jgi:hypothetical protein
MYRRFNVIPQGLLLSLLFSLFGGKGARFGGFPLVSGSDILGGNSSIPLDLVDLGGSKL